MYTIICTPPFTVWIRLFIYVAVHFSKPAVEQTVFFQFFRSCTSPYKPYKRIPLNYQTMSRHYVYMRYA